MQIDIVVSTVPVQKVVDVAKETLYTGLQYKKEAVLHGFRTMLRQLSSAQKCPGETTVFSSDS